MRRLIAVLLLGLLLAGCGGSDEGGMITVTTSSTTTTSTTTTTVATTTAPDPLTAALTNAGFRAPSDEVRESLQVMCLHAATDPQEFYDSVTGDQDVADMLGAAFPVLCPEQVARLDGPPPTTTTTTTAPPGPSFDPGYPREVPLDSLPPGPRSFIERRRPGATTAVMVGPGVWTPRGESTTVEQDAAAGGFYGFCSDIEALEQRLGDERGGACW